MRRIGLDLEAIGLKPHGGTIWSLTIREAGKKTEVYHDCYGLKNVPAKVKKDLQDPNVMKIIHRSEYDGPYLELVLGIKIPNIWDTQWNEVVILGKRVNGDAPPQILKHYSSQLKWVLPRYGFKAPDKEIRENFIDRPFGKKFTRDELTYMVSDVKDLPEVQKAQEYLLRRDGLMDVALLENKVSEKIIQMRVNGIGFDQKIWLQIAAENEKEFAARMARLPKEVKNWNSPKQVKEYFFSKGILLESFKELSKVYLQTRNKTLGDFIFARELHKSVTTYGRNWLEEGYIDADGRIRCSYDQIIDTGRMSSSEPNLQQLPGQDIKNPQKIRAMTLIREQLKLGPRVGAQHRRAFVSKPGYKFVIGDFSGQEMGIMAAASGEDLWIEAMMRGEDIHALTASKLYGPEWAKGAEKGCQFPFKCKCKKHKQLREPTKILNFMLAYGGGAQKFSDDTGVDMVTATATIAKYKRIIPRLTDWLNKNGNLAVNTGKAYSADPYRRRRMLHGEEEWHIRNQGKNTPIQAAGANMLKLAMISIPDEFQMVLVVHDEIVLEVPNKLVPKAAKMLKQVMEKSADYITGIKGLIKVEPRIATDLFKE